MATATRTVMFTDVVGFLEKAQNDGRKGIHRLLERHREVVQPLATRFGGRIVKNLGDGYMCVFDSATDAVRAALEMQSLVRGGEASIRITMATGDVEELEGDAYGNAANLAGRLAGAAPQGEIWFSEGTRVCMNDAEVPWDVVGRFRFKGIAREVPVYRAVPEQGCWLPEAVAEAAKGQRLVRVQRGGPLPNAWPPEAVVLLEGFTPGSAELNRRIGALPVLDPASVWLSTYLISPGDRTEWVEAGHGVVVGTPHALDKALETAVKVRTRSFGSETLVFDSPLTADLEVAIEGLALPAVPLSDVVASYYYDLLSDGRWVNRSENAALRIEVTPEGVKLHVLSRGVKVDGQSRPAGDVMALHDGAKVSTLQTEHTFRAADGPYAGLLMGQTPMSMGASAGQTTELGREPSYPGLAFPDRRGQANIRWCAGKRAARAKAGGFTLDRALAGRRQAAVCLLDDVVHLTPLHDRCATYVVTEGSPTPVRITTPTPMKPGEHVVAGTTVVSVRRPDVTGPI